MALLASSYKSIWKIAYPIIVGSFAQSIISVTDTAFMGRIGSIEQAAIGLVGVYYLILFMIGFSYTKGTQIFVARRLGEKRHEDIGKITDNSLIVMFLFSLLLFVFLRFFAESSLSLLIQDLNVLKASVAFLEVRSYGIVFGFCGSLFLSFYMGIGNTLVILAGILIMSGLNVLLNYILIFGKWGFPQMGIQGAAWASNIAEIVAAIIFVTHAIIAKYHEKFKLFKFRFSIAIIKDITNLSFPIVMQTFIGLLAWMIFFIFVEKMGTNELAISSVVKSIYTIFGIPAWGFSSAANTIVSNLMGQKRPDEVSKAIKRIVFFSMSFTAILSLPIIFFPEAFMRFYTVDEAVIMGGKYVIYVCMTALIIYSSSTIMFNGIVSTGTSKVSLAIEVIAVVVYLGYIYSIFQIENLSLPLVWTAELFYWFVIALISFIYLKTGRWKTKQI
jgi:putative MATE family efflux protein